jgi:uncharacterized zinc-type alcohol dehydrogenase-like protein
MEANPPGEIPKCLDSEYPEVAWGKEAKDKKISSFTIPRAKVTDYQVKFEMLYCGICHTDTHIGNNDWGGTKYPCVPGHELLGKVTEVGAKVTKFKVGDHVGVGCLVDACKDCFCCNEGNEQYCMKGMTGTYNGTKQHGRVGGNQDTQTFGGYTGSNVVHEDFVIKMPDGIDLEKAAPILCAGITMYSPLNHWKCTKGGKTVGVVGVGGLGTMGIKLAKALGNKVVAISTSAKKEQIAKDKGADIFVVSTDEASMKANAGLCDVILNTVSADHQLSTYLPLLAKSGTLVQIGGVTGAHSMVQMPLLFSRLSVSGSLIGGIKETQECIDLCAAKGIYPDCKTVEAKDIDWCWDQLTGSNPDGIRFVIDIKKSLENKEFLPPQ